MVVANQQLFFDASNPPIRMGFHDFFGGRGLHFYRNVILNRKIKLQYWLSQLIDVIDRNKILAANTPFLELNI